MEPNEYLRRLGVVLADFRFDEVPELTAAIDPTAFEPRQAERALGLLRRKRQFEELEKTAALFQFSGVDSPKLRRLWAQALLDQSKVAEALPGLKGLARRVEDDPGERSEVRGLIGRAHKQLYVDGDGAGHLGEAIGAYRIGWQAREGDYRWHGINLAALLARAERDGVDPGVPDEATTVAAEILREIDDLGSGARYWDFATAMEASLALDRGAEEVAAWVKRYVADPDVDAFELASTLRQMREIWKLEETETGRRILPVLEGELARREGSVLELAPAAAPDERVFEIVYGPEGTVQIEWVLTLQRRTLSVGRVFNTASGTRYGTGFLVRGAALRPGWGDEPVFVTNSHVVSPDPGDEAPLAPGDASVEFTRVEGRPAVELGPLLFTCVKNDLDVSVLRVAPPAGATVLEPSFARPPDETGGKPRIFVMGHPAVGELQVSLYDNRLVDYDDPYVLYRSPTRRGSSGSPVFTRDWKLFALHHGARGAKLANEGVLLGPIRDRCGDD